VAKGAAPRWLRSVGELLGPAGAGKTTLLRELSRRDPRIVPGPLPSRLELLPHYARHAALLLPSALRHPGAGLAFQEREARAMTYVRAWQRPVGRLADAGHCVLMDHGPIFRLAFLREFGSPLARTPRFARWWERALGEWESALDVVIRLDAPDPVLLERVRGREIGHAIKAQSDFDGNLFLRRYRTAFEEVMSRFGPAGPAVLCFDTSKQGVDEIADAVIEALETDGGTA
jgi:hypothetical protein